MVKNINAAGQYGNSQFTVSQTSVEAAYTTIQEAVTEATGSGGTIYIYPGTYTESISWPGGITVIGAGKGDFAIGFDVIIDGNQTFNSGGTSSFQNLFFRSFSGNTATIDDAGGSLGIEFKDCIINASAGKGIVSTTPGAHFININLESSLVSASDNAIDASGNTTVITSFCQISTTTDNLNTVELNDSSSINPILTQFSTSTMGTGSCIALNGATSSVESFDSKYICGDSANASAFLFTIAGGTVRTLQDEMNTVGGTYWARSTGAFGSLTYGSTTIDTGTTRVIDPQITATLLDELTIHPGAVQWSDHGVSTIVDPNTGSVSTAAVTLTLPPSPSNGDVCEFILGTSSTLNVSGNAGQMIRIGNLLTPLAGTASSFNQGNTLKLVYNSTLTSWIATSLIGNWVI